MIRHRSALALAGLLAGCWHPLPPQSTPRWGYDTRAIPPVPAPGTYTPPVPPRAPVGTPAPAKTRPPYIPHFAPVPDPANPYPAPDPALPPDARAT